MPVRLLASSMTDRVSTPSGAFRLRQLAFESPALIRALWCTAGEDVPGEDAPGEDAPSVGVPRVGAPSVGAPTEFAPSEDVPGERVASKAASSATTATVPNTLTRSSGWR